MLYVLQLAIGVCAGLFLFRWLNEWRPRLPQFRMPTVKETLIACSFIWAALYLLDLILLALRTD